MFFEVLIDLVHKLCPEEEVRIEMPPEIDYNWDEPEPIDELDVSATQRSPSTEQLSHRELSVEQLGKSYSSA